MEINTIENVKKPDICKISSTKGLKKTDIKYDDQFPKNRKNSHDPKTETKIN